MIGLRHQADRDRDKKTCDWRPETSVASHVGDDPGKVSTGGDATHKKPPGGRSTQMTFGVVGGL